ncbi:MAG: hypothetical protein AVDCRST_MAG41-4499 [uncultured Corynebacteriales bacterium]|uniref:Uncharacterized protein n=1 Tax=uncultured Mycobacteriales bacterium TaxID=581187 RepID=A0A6J4JXE9_9ACTN|nr:MAG: hypothetical protein AVDCRST_MAG41-4499 [uncultured Corynebacteriales bacterium]
MSMSRSPEQRARFVRAAATDLDTAPEVASRLLFLSEAAREHAGSGARPADGVLRALLDCLLDDDVCRYGWWVADEGEALWRLLMGLARLPRDVGPAILLAVALARRDAAADALQILLETIRAGEFRRPAIECAAELAEDCGRPDVAWSLVVRLGLAHADHEWGALRCVLGCSARRQCERSRLAGVTHARWLRHRVARWARRQWSGAQRSPAYRLVHPYVQGRQRWGAMIGGYLAARGTSLPPGERQLLDGWTRVVRREVTVVATSRWETVLSDADSRWTAGWEAASTVGPGTRISCWLLPTLRPGEWLAARSIDVPTW